MKHPCAWKGWMILLTARSETECTTWWRYPGLQPATPPTQIGVIQYTRFVVQCCRVTGTKVTTFLRPLVAYLYFLPPASISCHTLRFVIYLTGLSVSSSLILRAKRLFLLTWLFSPQPCCFAPDTPHEFGDHSFRFLDSVVCFQWKPCQDASE